MPSADKRQRKKENARAAREARQAEARRRRRLRSLRNFTITAVVLVAGILIINQFTGGDGSKSTSSTTTSASVTTTTVKLPAGCVYTIPTPAKPQIFKNPPPMTIDAAKTYTATISTSCGDIKVALDAENAPKGVNNFVFLARKGFYDGVKWNRVVKGFVIQGGDPQGTGGGGPGYEQVTETPANGYKQGTLAWAKTGTAPNGSAGSQFFIVTGTDTPSLQEKKGNTYQYGVFGQVSGGLANALKLESLSRGDGPPAHDIYILKVTITES